MEVAYFKYSLTPRIQLNRFGKSDVRSGVLLRIDRDYFLDYHPWSEFGDIGIHELLELLKKSHELPPYLATVLVLEKNRESILTKPFFNHDLTETPGRHYSGCIKIKYLNDLNLLKTTINNTESNSIRIDFNNALTPASFLRFYSELSDKLRQRIEYFEDPFPMDTKGLDTTLFANIPLACDRNKFNSDLCKYNIFKPNADCNPLDGITQVFSSYMGHDLGRYHAYLSLMKYGDLKLHHGIDTPNIYHEQLNFFNNKDGQLMINTDLVNKIYSELHELEWHGLI